MNRRKLEPVVLLVAVAVGLVGCSATASPATKSDGAVTSDSAASTPSAGAVTPSPTAKVPSLLPAGIRSDGFYKQNSSSGYDLLVQFNADGTVSGLYTVVDARDLAENPPGSGKLLKYWLKTPESSGDPQSPQEYGPNVDGVTRKPLAPDLTFGYKTPSQGAITYKILSVARDTIRISEDYSGGVLTSDWTFTEY